MSAVDRAFCRQLPKIEGRQLHAHLSGSISRSCLHSIWQLKKQREPGLDLQDPLIAIPPGKVDYDLTSFFPLFSSYIYELCSDLASIKHSTASLLQDFEADNVVYLELRTTPREVPRHVVSKALYVQTILDCISQHEAQPQHRLRTRLILSVDRRNTREQALEVVALAANYRDSGVVGVDLCGDPAKGPINTFAPAFAQAKAAGLKVTLHFAEAPVSSTPEELWELLSWQPDRLGHVIHVGDELRTAIVRARIGVELCLSCNVHAGMIAGSYAHHHFGWWKDNHVAVALCVSYTDLRPVAARPLDDPDAGMPKTDDVGVFCSPLSEEYYLAASHFGLDKDAVRQLCMATVDMIFDGDAEKARLRKVYAEWGGW